MKCIALAALILSGVAHAQANDTTLRGWRAALAGDPRLDLPVMTIVKPAAKGYTVVPVGNVENFEKTTGFRVRTSSEFDWTAKLNGAPTVLSGSLQDVAKNLNADLVVVSRPGASWQLATQSTTTDVAAAKSMPKTSAEWSAWLNQALGYDGVVVASDSDYVLVRRTSANLDRSPFGLVVGNSADAVSLAEGKRQGAGMIKQIENDGTFAVYRLEMGERTGIPAGTKVLLQ